MDRPPISDDVREFQSLEITAQMGTSEQGGFSQGYPCMCEHSSQFQEVNDDEDCSFRFFKGSFPWPQRVPDIHVVCKTAASVSRSQLCIPLLVDFSEKSPYNWAIFWWFALVLVILYGGGRVKSTLCSSILTKSYLNDCFSLHQQPACCGRAQTLTSI